MKSQDTYAVARRRMIQEQIVGRGVRNQSVLRAFDNIPRHEFVDDALKDQAYMDAPLNIGEGQTISQPYIVALMTQALELTGKERVLEIGTGCGYQTVVLSLLASKVFTIERVRSLSLAARQRFKRFGLKNIVVRIGDGSLGWAEEAPFDRILMACVSPVILQNLKSQLAVGGVMVLPVSGDGEQQVLLKIRKTQTGFEEQKLGDCRFVKLIGKHGYDN